MQTRPVSAAGNPVSSNITYLRDHPGFYERTHALGERMRASLTGICADLGIAATAADFGGVFSLYFTESPIRGYRDLMRNNDAAYVAFHHRMTDRGFLMLPLALKRNHISAAHTEQDVDRTLEAARDALRTIRDDGLLTA
ncbi:hypothetical protein F8568_044075 [Actinomadura sp. LD22]|uniref:Glutamate-1-semialdehyde 2,1-aminomutase n=1 Tax=Actinomadura physcomitrii TaxID=2650748 RepID=A0A6I4MN15_9ACTN|nr:hypothetical protein [Actinomadura physcomitrii]MWA07202.1 hypothetical protein [Actinomadura physcomitrii]